MQSITTADTFQAAYFLATGGKLTKCEVLTGPYVMFQISGEDIIEAHEKYKAGHARIDPISLQESLSYVKEHLYEFLERENRKRF